jgi:hypothetical protein
MTIPAQQIKHVNIKYGENKVGQVKYSHKFGLFWKKLLLKVRKLLNI